MNANKTESTTAAARIGMGRLLVSVQLVMIGVLALLALRAFIAAGVPAIAWILLAAGVALGIWAVSANRPGNFNIRPEPREGGVLIRHGPYRWIRHPMYTAVMVCGLACAVAADNGWGWACLVTLIVVLVIKAGVEEHGLLHKHPDYARGSSCSAVTVSAPK